MLMKPVRVPLEALRLLQRWESVCRGRVSVVEAIRGHESASRGHKGVNKGRESPIVIIGEPKEAGRV